MVIEELEKRFGTKAVEKGFINFDQLMEALEIQVREDMEGKKHRLIGRIFFDMGLMTLPQIEEVLVCIPLIAVTRWGEIDHNAGNEDLLITLEQNRVPSLT